jgi:hypothetical protein
MYRGVRDNTIAEFEWRDGKLTLNKRLSLKPLAAGRFAAPVSGDEFHFDDANPTRVRVATPNGDLLLERVLPAQPTAEELASVVGEYESAETGSTVVVVLGRKPGELMYHIGANAPVMLQPAYKDVFTTPSGLAIRFIRDSSGKVVSLSAGDARVWDLRMQRVR